jgi:pimeloyl-ACP methyl ester carboxylesterase
MHRPRPFPVAALMLMVILMLAPVLTAQQIPARDGRTSTAATEASPGGDATAAATTVHHRTITIDGLRIFYREAGPADAPAVLLLHGFPTSSHMFRDLIPQLADRYRVIAPDYPGFGQSSMPSVTEFDYTFDRMAQVVERFTETVGLTSYTLYVQDYGAPIGFRLAAAHPDRVDALIIQNGNAYNEGLREFWKPLKEYWSDPTLERREVLRGFLTGESTKWQYLHGVRDTTRVSPDAWTMDQSLLERPGNQEIQLAMFYDYRTNLPLYPRWQAYFREHQPPTLIVWGKNDQIFPPEGAHPYRRDLETVELHLLDTGHFALEEKGAEIAGHIRGFLAKHVRR